MTEDINIGEVIFKRSPSLIRIIVPLLIQFFGIVWVARGMVMQIESNTETIKVIAKEQTERSRDFYTTVATVKGIEKQLTGMDARQVRMESMLIEAVKDK